MTESINKKLSRELSTEEIDQVSGGDLQSPVTFGTTTYPPAGGGGLPSEDDQLGGDPSQDEDEDFGVDLQWPF